MTGFVEAATVLGFISAITGICDAAHQVYEAYADKSGLPRKFRASADQLPLIRHALDLAHANITTGNVEQGSLQVALPVLNRCKEEVGTVKAIFDKCLSTKDARRRERLFGAVYTLRKGGDLSENMEIIVKNLELLAQHRIFQDSDTIQKLAEAVQRLEASHTRHLDILPHLSAGSSGQLSSGNSGQEGHNSGVQTSPVWMVPFERNVSFAGRDAEIKRLRECVFTEDRTARVAVAGLGGIGKTHLIIEFLYRIREEEEFARCPVLWIPAMGEETILQGYIDVGKALNLPDLDNNAVDVRKIVQTHLSQSASGPWILVFDNADDSSFWFHDNRAGPDHPLLFDLLPKNSQGSIIFTSRDARLASKVGSPHVLHLSHVDETVGRQLLGNYLNDRQLLDNEADTTALLQWLGYLPLAIVQAATYINENMLTLGQYLSLLNSQDEDVIRLLSQDFNDLGRYGTGMNPIATTWLVSFVQLRERNHLAVRYLSFISCVARKDIPLALLPTTDSTQDAIEALGALKSYSFVSQDPKTQSITVHRLVHLVMRNWMQNEGVLPEYSKYAARQLQFILQDTMTHRIDQWRPFLPHAHYLFNSSRDICPTVERIDFLRMYGFCLHLHDRRLEARATLQEAVALSETLEGPGPDGALGCSAMTLLGVTYTCLKKYDMAESVLLIAIKGYEKIKTKEVEEDLINAKTYLSSVYRLQERLQEAETLQKQILESSKTILGAGHPSTLGILSNLSTTVYLQGRLQEALDLSKKALEGHVAVLGQSHRNTLQCLSVLAGIYHDMGNLLEAERLYGQVLEGERVTLGCEHPYTLYTVYDLSKVLYRQRRRQEALGMLELCAEGRRHTLGADHADTILATKLIDEWRSKATASRRPWASLWSRRK